MSDSAENTQRWKITLAYDGQPFEGWQSQPSGNTIQDHVEAALKAVTGLPRCAVQGSGRTDAGAHAEGQVAHFDVPAGVRLKPENWTRGLNVHLPPTIRILGCERVPSSFHARFSARAKRYRYEIHVGDILPPHLHGRAWSLRQPLHETRLASGLACLCGRHDFRCFAANRGKNARPPDSFVRTLHEATFRHPGVGRISLEFYGDGFLYKMVRLMVGGLVALCEGRLSSERWRALVEGTSPAKSPFCAPAAGLFLVAVTYDAPNTAPPSRAQNPKLP